MKRMLINATHSEEIRVALADGQKLYNLDIDVPGQDRKKGNIYKGRITRVEPSLEAAFVDYGANRHGFLPYKEISRNYYTEAANKAKERPPIAKAIKEGTEVIIQVNKEERGNKGAAISTYISLAGRYLVYMPENPKAGGISRRIEGKARQDLKDSLDKVTQPKNSGIIVRTAGIGRTAEELNWDLNYLDQVWTAIKTVAANRKAPFFLYQESDIFIRALRDYLRPDVGEILIDNKEIFEKARDFMQQVMPHNLKKLSYYNDTIPLFSRYQIESQIQSAFSREVQLPSGGSLVIDHTEAMISIDINSARATKGADIEETALNTNIEAADEIARQLRIRDLGGLVVIDFIDMRNHKNQRAVENQLNDAISNDRARVQTSKISRFGLLEMSRQRLKSSINESSQYACPRCSGHGFIRNIESLSVSILRILEEEALKPETGKVIAQVPTKVANFIINEKREELNNLEARHSVPMLIIANEHYQSPQFDIKRLKKSEADLVDINNLSLNNPEVEEMAEAQSNYASKQFVEKAAVDVLVPDSQAPSRAKTGVVSRWLKNLFNSNKIEETKSRSQQDKTKQKTASQNSKTSRYQNSKTQKNNQQQKAKGHPKAQTKVNNNRTKQKKQQPLKSNKQQELKQKNKPQNKQQNKPQKKEVKSHQGQAKHQKQESIKQQNVNLEKPDSTVDMVNPNSNEQMLQRPLGSVASYAAQKAKNVDENINQTSKNVDEKISQASKKLEAPKPIKKTEQKKEAHVTQLVKDSSASKQKPAKKVEKDDSVNESNVVVSTTKSSPEKKDSPVVSDVKKSVEKAQQQKTDKPKKGIEKNLNKVEALQPKEVGLAEIKEPPKKVVVKSEKELTKKVQKETKQKATQQKPKPKNEVEVKEKQEASKKSKVNAKPELKKTKEVKLAVESKLDSEVKSVKKTEHKSKNSQDNLPNSKAEKPKSDQGIEKNKNTAKSKRVVKDKLKDTVQKDNDKQKNIKQVPVLQKSKTQPKKKMPDPTSGIDFDI